MQVFLVIEAQRFPAGLFSYTNKPGAGVISTAAEARPRKKRSCTVERSFMKRKFLEDLGLEKDVIDQIMAENGKDIEAEKKKTEKAEGERDSLQSQLTTAQDTLKGFEGIDPADIQRQITDWKKKAEDAERDYKEKLEKRDFDDALKAELETVKFSSEAAKKAVMAEITEAGLKLKDGKIMGLSDLLSQIKERDASAFVDEEEEEQEQNKARFTTPLGHKGSGKKYGSWEEIMDIKDPSERQRAISENMNLFEGKE